MLYVMRLMSGDCVIASARDEQSALDIANRLGAEDGETVVSVRQLSPLAVRLSPNDQGSLDVNSWDDATLDDILVHEYPILNEAFHRANSIAFMPATSVEEPGKTLTGPFRQAFEQNTEIIRKGLQLEKERFIPERTVKARKVAHK